MKYPSRISLIFFAIVGLPFFLAFVVFLVIVALDNLESSQFDFQRFPPEMVSGQIQSYRELVTSSSCSVYLYVNDKKYNPWLLSCKDAHRLKDAHVRILYSRELDTEVGLEIGADKIFGIKEWKEGKFNGFLSPIPMVLLLGAFMITIAWEIVFGKKKVIRYSANRSIEKPAATNPKSGTYVPNSISLGKRAFNIVAAMFLLIYGSYGIYINDLYIPGRRGRGIHLLDQPALLMFSAIVCASLIFISVIVDHYDTRNNENKYTSLTRLFKFLGWSLFIGAFVLHATREVNA